MNQATDPRMDIAAEDATETGFNLVLRTWDDTHVARVQADWTAIGEMAHEDDRDLSV